jgi:hypothetical protein
MSFARTHLDETKAIIDQLDVDVIERITELLTDLRARAGRLFFSWRRRECRQLLARSQ